MLSAIEMDNVQVTLIITTKLLLIQCSERSAARSSQAAEQHSRSAIRCSPSLTKRPPAGRTGGFLGARAARAVASVCMREDAAARRGLQCHREPRSTSCWSAACPMSPTGHCAARGSRAHHRPDQLADWPRSAVRFIYCRLKPCDDACAHARSFASTWALPTNSRATGVFSPRRIRRSNVARAQTKSRITPMGAKNEKGAY